MSKQKSPGTGPPEVDRGVDGRTHHGWCSSGREERRGCWACTHTSICRVDSLIGLGTFSIHKLAPNEKLVGHLEDQLVHCFFHLGRNVSVFSCSVDSSQMGISEWHKSTWRHKKHLGGACLSSTYRKTGMIQRRFAWPLHKDDRQIHETFHIFMNKYLSTIALNVNGLNGPIKRHRVFEWVRKHDQHICCLQDTHLRTKHPH